MYAAGRDLRGPDFVRSLKAAKKSVQEGFAAFTTTLPIK